MAFVVGEVLAGLISHSLALLSDAGHNLADAVALLLSWYAVGLVLRPRDANKTFGYHRAGTLAAVANALGLVAIALIIIWEAIQRLYAPVPVSGAPMVVVALLAVVLNAGISWWLHEGARHDLNMRSAYLHMVGDALSGVGVAVAGLIVWLTGKSIADPLVSLLIGGLILYSSRSIWAEALGTLMEAVPAGVEVSALEQTLCTITGIRGIHCLHTWTVGSGVKACSCHVTIDPAHEAVSQDILRTVIATLEGKYDFAHTTVQLEVDGAAPSDACEHGVCRECARAGTSDGATSHTALPGRETQGHV